MILHDPRNPIAVRHAEALHQALAGRSVEGATVVIGGDGFLLHTVAERGLDRTYVGLNAGRVGFLLNDVSDWGRTADALAEGTWTPWDFPVLEARCEDLEGRVHTARAVNDVYLERASGQTARLGVTVDGARVVETLVADGVVVSTALGSTAYNFSAGGPACHPTLRVLNVTPICPHLPRLPPFALPETSRIDLEVQAAERRPVRCVADGRQVARVRHLTIRVGEGTLTLAVLDGHDFTARMVGKILHP